MREEGFAAPAVILISPVIALREELAWFERRPLFGKRVLVTRPQHQAGDMVHRLIDLGAVPFILPTVEIREIADWSLVDQAIRVVRQFDWLVFTSPNGVMTFFEYFFRQFHDMRDIGGARIAAVGPATANSDRNPSSAKMFEV